jgi:putative component of membrane protein insertase Oxa1/YidC/SpoIIIJ protein YidD
MRFSLLFICLVPVLLYARPGYFVPWGKDADLCNMPQEVTEEQQTPSVFVSLSQQIILFHQHVISPVDGPRSHFRPSSSNYMLLAMRKYGFLKGFVLGCDRLMRENGDEWVYRTIETEGAVYKYNPVP